jgi:hypothetical protein
MVNNRIKTLAEIKMFKRNYKNLMNKVGAASAVSKNRERIKHDIKGGCIDIDNKQNKKVFEYIMDEVKVLREKIRKYKDMPGKYGNVASKFMQAKNQNHLDVEDPMKLLLKTEDLNYIQKTQFAEQFNKLKLQMEEKKRSQQEKVVTFERISRSLENKRYTI